MHRPAWAPPGIDLEQASAARMYDYFLGGSHNVAADRALGDQVLASWPDLGDAIRGNRSFIHRAVRYVAEQGVRQFLDVGSGIPAMGTVHESARAVVPDARVVYVDHDPTAVAHGRAILASTAGTTMTQGDLREPEKLLADPEVRELLDPDQPVGLLMVSLLHFVPDSDDPPALLARYRDAVAPGSYLIVSHGTSCPHTERLRSLYESGGVPLQWRGEAELRRLLSGFELVEPGIVIGPRWRTDPADEPADPPEWWHGGLAAVGRRP